MALKKAPDFSCADETGKIHTLKDYRGKKLVLFFYPKDNTPGCTQESCDFRDNLSEMNKLNVAVLGASKDSAKSHVKFKEKFDLNYPLLVDEDESLCKAFDVIKEKNMYGKTYMGIERSTFLINENGEIEKEWRKVSVKGHAEEVLEALK